MTPIMPMTPESGSGSGSGSESESEIRSIADLSANVYLIEHGYRH